jgi:hypothetical protein
MLSWVSAVGVTVAALTACSFGGTDYKLVDDRVASGGMAGDTSTGGSSNETGGSDSGGSETGGADTGGSNSGGSDSGGSDSGGSDSGGSNSGGMASGGMASGGMASGGGPGVGGSATGGTPGWTTVEFSFPNVTEGAQGWEVEPPGGELNWTDETGLSEHGALALRIALVDDPGVANTATQVCVRLSPAARVMTVRAHFSWYSETNTANTGAVAIVLRSPGGQGISGTVSTEAMNDWTIVEAESFETEDPEFDPNDVTELCLYAAFAEVPSGGDTLMMYFDDIVIN